MRLVKDIGKFFVTAILSWQVRRLLAKHPVKTIGVVGSYGKTSTKFAVAAVLKQCLQIRFQEGNYNDIVTVPLVFFDEPTPSLMNPLAWLGVFMRNERQIRGPYPYDAVVLELGTDSPGQIGAFARYFTLDIAVLTSIAYEHMEFFADLQAVAHEELAIKNFSKQVLFNGDLCARDYVQPLAEQGISFGRSDGAQYKIIDVQHQAGNYSFGILHNGKTEITASFQAVAPAQLYSACVAAIIGSKLDMAASDIAKGIATIRPANGRMQLLRGIRGSTILDDTYNASPEACKASLDVLYDTQAPQKIALLGNMNELGSYSQVAHYEVGDYCDPKRLNIVLTLGPDANSYLAPAAHARGCLVVPCKTPYEAGEYMKQHISKGAVVLAKGSQNNVFAEEAVKLILADPSDAKLLVRQSPGWFKKKTQAFGTLPKS